MSIFHIEIAALDKTVVDSFTKTMCAITTHYANGGLPADVQKNLRTWGVAAKPAAQLLSLELYPTILKKALKGEQFEEEEAVLFGRQVKAGLPSFEAQKNIPIEYVNLVKDSANYLRTNSEGAFRRIEKNVSTLEDASLNAAFVQEVGSQKPFLSALAKIVKATGGQGVVLEPEQLTDLKNKKPLLAKEYMRLRRGVNEVWKQAMMTYIRGSGKKYVPFTMVEDFLKSKNLTSTLPVGFVGNIDDKGRLYTANGKILNGVPGPLFPTVRMNPDYDEAKDSGWVFQAIRRDGTVGSYFYTENYVRHAKKSKFEKVGNLIEDIMEIRKKWLAILKTKKFDDPKVIGAIILELLTEFSARVGTGTSGQIASGEKTYGIGNLRVQHCTFKAGSAILSYKGKDGVPHKHIIPPNTDIHKIIIAALIEKTKEKKKDDFIWTVTKGNRMVKIGASFANKLFISLGAKTTVHKLRSVIASLIFDAEQKKVMAKEGKKGKQFTDKEGFDLLKKIATAVGERLNHVRRKQGAPDKVTPATALQAYIDPMTQARFLDSLGVRYPNYLAKLINKEV